MFDPIDVLVVLLVLALVFFVLCIFPFRHPDEAGEVDTRSSTRETSLGSTTRDRRDSALEQGSISGIQEGGFRVVGVGRKGSSKRSSKARPSLLAVEEERSFQLQQEQSDQHQPHQPLLKANQEVLTYGST